MLRQNKIECLPLAIAYPSLRLASKEPDIREKISGVLLRSLPVLSRVYIGESWHDYFGDNNTQQ